MELYYRYSQIGSGPYIRNAQQYERDTVMHTCWFLVLGLWFIIPNTNANLNTALTGTPRTKFPQVLTPVSATLFLVYLWVGKTDPSEHLRSSIYVFAVRPALNISVHKYVKCILMTSLALHLEHSDV